MRSVAGSGAACSESRHFRGVQTFCVGFRRLLASAGHGQQLHFLRALNNKTLALCKGNQLDFYDWRARILSITVEWIKSFSEFKGIPSSDQRSLIVHCSFALLVFSEAFQTPERFSDRLVYPDGLQVTRNFSRGICIPQNGLIRGIVAVINFILAPIRRIQLTEVEYVFLQTLLLFDTDCLSLSESTLRLTKK
uniref:NR LBD domain-containing protein n=1 Tax=Globodera pallida TaxID=36090 RepID=A0A183BZX3_GLOPA